MIGRRPVLAGLALAMLGAPSAAIAGRKGMEETEVYGLIGKITAIPGKRDALIAILASGTADMAGCLTYIIAEDRADADAIWITEIWTTKQHHDDSLKLPEVRDAIARGRPLIAGFETAAETRPVAGRGIKG